MKAKDFRCDGVMTLSNFGGIEIMLNDCGDAAIYRWYGKLAQRWQEIKFSTKGRAYITIQGSRYYLDNFIKVA